MTNNGQELDVIEPQGAPAVPEPIMKRREAVWLWFIAMGAVGLMGLGFVVGVFTLAWAGREIPDGVWPVFLMIVTGLVSFLTLQGYAATKPGNDA